MIRQKNLLPIILFFTGVLVSGCRHVSLRTHPDTIREWLAEEPDSCLWYVTGQYVPLLNEKKYAEMEQLYADVLRNMPDSLSLSKRSKDVDYLMGWVLTYYYNALMLQDKVKNSEHLTDSLLQSGHSYYSVTLRPELLAASAKFCLAQDRQDRVDSLGRLFVTLPPTDDPRRDARTWHQMAWTLEFSSIDTELPMRLMEHAVSCCRQMEGKVGNEGEIYSYLGYLYWKNGALEKAAVTIQQAIDWYTARPGTPGDGLIEAYSDLSRVYTSLGLYDKAIEANSRAIGHSKLSGNWMLEEVYRQGASCFSSAGEPDSALYYIQKSIEATPQSAETYYIRRLNVERLGYYYEACPDSIGSRLEECHRLLKDTANMDEVPRTSLKAYYGMALLHTPGRAREGVDYLEKSFRAFHSGHFPEGIVRTGNELIRAYIQTGMRDRIASVYPVYTYTRDSLEQQKKVNAAIGANIRYETARKEQENRALSAEVLLQHRTLTFTWVLVGLLGGLLVASGLYLRQRQRYLRRISDARLSQISALLQSQQELHEKNDSLLRMGEELRRSNEALFHAREELENHNLSLKEELQAASTELQQASGRLSEMSSELENLAKRKAISDMREKISTELFDSNREAEFRRNFTAVCPHYLSSLHQLCPTITRTDELIAMLLLLDLSSDEIGLTLGISRHGVNKARSRMRQRLGLATEIKLEDFLKGL